MTPDYELGYTAGLLRAMEILDSSLLDPDKDAYDFHEHESILSGNEALRDAIRLISVAEPVSVD